MFSLELCYRLVKQSGQFLKFLENFFLVTFREKGDLQVKIFNFFFRSNCNKLLYEIILIQHFSVHSLLSNMKKIPKQQFDFEEYAWSDGSSSRSDEEVCVVYVFHTISLNTCHQFDFDFNGEEPPLSKEEEDPLYDDLADDSDAKWMLDNLESKI